MKYTLVFLKESETKTIHFLKSLQHDSAVKRKKQMADVCFPVLKNSIR